MIGAGARLHALLLEKHQARETACKLRNNDGREINPSNCCIWSSAASSSRPTKSNSRISPRSKSSAIYPNYKSAYAAWRAPRRRPSTMPRCAISSSICTGSWSPKPRRAVNPVSRPRRLRPSMLDGRGHDRRIPKPPRPGPLGAALPGAYRAAGRRLGDHQAPDPGLSGPPLYGAGGGRHLHDHRRIAQRRARLAARSADELHLHPESARRCSFPSRSP